ncbi:MAG: hypothetical protein A2Y18_00835 [Clostridiales bacterium GWD2_32_19]|nr:MAG: hypothetical protein A2Y18_00835 [Clostridiales bacterium GWD2_32_19]
MINRGVNTLTCEKLAACPFYNDKMTVESGIGSIYKKRYCEGNNLICARHKVSVEIGKEFVPENLYPNMLERAEEIIKEHKENNTNKTN